MIILMCSERRVSDKMLEHQKMLAGVLAAGPPGKKKTQKYSRALTQPIPSSADRSESTVSTSVPHGDTFQLMSPKYQ